MEKTYALLFALLMMTVSLAGCLESDDEIAEDGNNNSEIITFNHQFEVIEVSGVTGPDSDSYCGSEEDEECHIFVVSISNIGTEDLSISPPYWSAIGDDGGIYTTYTGDGLSKIIPGATTEISLGFDVSNGVKLTTLRFNSQTLDSDYEWLLDSTDIPSYDIVQSFNVTLNVSASSVEDDGDHILNVTVTNDGLLDFKSNMFYWEATGDDGNVYDAPDRDGEDEVVAGSTGIVTLSFDVPNGVKLTTLQWDDNANSVNCSIPTY